VRVKCFKVLSIVLFILLVGIIQAQDAPYVKWKGQTYKGKVKLILKDGRRIEGFIAGGEHDELIKIVPQLGGAEVPFKCSLLESIETLGYDNSLEQEADQILQKAEKVITDPAQACKDPDTLQANLDSAVEIYQKAHLIAIKPEDQKRLSGKIRKAGTLMQTLETRLEDDQKQEKQEQHWQCVIEAKDRADYARYIELLFEHLQKWSTDQRAHKEFNHWILNYENLSMGEKGAAAVNIGRYFDACSKSQCVPAKVAWDKFPFFFKTFLEYLKQPGGCESLVVFHNGALGIKTLVENNEEIRSHLSTWSAQVKNISPKDYLRNSAVNEVRRDHVNAGDKVRALVQLYPEIPSYEIYAEWCLNQRNIPEAFRAYNEIVKLKPGGDPKTERWINILRYLEDTFGLMTQGELEKARDNLERVWGKKQELPQPIIKLVFNMVAQCDLLILDKQLSQREDKESFYDYTLSRLAYFTQSFFADQFFDRFKNILLVLPIKYEVKINSQGQESLPSPSIMSKIKNLVGQEEAYDSRLVLVLDLDLDVEKDLDSKTTPHRRKIKTSHDDDDDDDDYRIETYYISDYSLVTRRSLEGRFELKTDGYGILFNKSFRDTKTERTSLGKIQSPTSTKNGIADPRFSALTAKESASDAMYSSSDFIALTLDKSGLKPLPVILNKIKFNPERKITP